jgi:hypothetical protein
MLQTEGSLKGLVDALMARDFDRLEQTLAPNVFFRALIPPGSRDANESDGAVKAFRGWFGECDRCELLQSRFDTIGEKHHASYRLRVRENGEWYLCEQQIYALIGEKGIERIDLLCSGFIPEK